MKILALDSSTSLLTVALAEGDIGAGNLVTVANISALGQRQHGELLAPTVAKLLEQVDWEVKDVEAIILGIGPGSYTGLRIGVTFAKVWAEERQIPLYTVSSLALIAANQMFIKEDTVVIPLIDARRGTVYTGLYRWFNQQLQSQYSDQHIDFERWLTKIEENVESADSVVIVGTDIEAFAAKFTQRYPNVECKVVSDWQAYPHVNRAFTYLELSKVEDLATLTPNYAHATLAEQEWEAKAVEQGIDISDHGNPERYIDHLK